MSDNVVDLSKASVIVPKIRFTIVGFQDTHPPIFAAVNMETGRFLVYPSGEPIASPSPGLIARMIQQFLPHAQPDITGNSPPGFTNQEEGSPV